MIDVSHYEPVPDYVKLKANGVGAVYAKASEHQPDSLFKAHIKAAQAAGLPCGGYHFMHAAGGMSGMAQADLYLSCVKDLKLELKHCLDWESGSADGMSSDHQQGVADGWLASVEKATGRVPCIYGGESFLNDLKLPIKYAKYPLWLAHYGCAESHLKIPFPWRAYAAWQYTDAEAIAGLSDGQHVDASHADLGALLD
jgi:lysozyme